MLQSSCRAPGAQRIQAPLALLLLFLAGPAWAAGGEMPSLVSDIGVSLLVAGALGVIFTRLKIPSIAAFLLAGMIIGPIGLGLVTDPVNIDTIAQLGFILLLFLIGLEIDFKKILGSGKPIIVSGLLQYPLTILFGILATKVMLLLGIGGELLAESPYAALYMGVFLAGSSTLLVVKLFQEHFELDTVPGRLSLGILIFQDIWVIIAVLIQPNLQNPDPGLIAMSFLGIILLSLFTVIVALSFVGRAFTWIAKTPEMTLLGALAWCFIVVFVGVNLDNIFMATYGRNIYVFPNPATREALAEFQKQPPSHDDPTGERVMFANLPRSRNKISIYTLDGDLVEEIIHDGTTGHGEAAWNLVSRNGQQVASGIYLYVVQAADGRFAAGSMRPKINSAVRFLEQGGKKVIITQPQNLRADLDEIYGTHIVP